MIKITYNDEVLLEKEFELDEARKKRIIDRVAILLLTTEEKIAISKIRQEEFEKTLTKEQKAEIARVAELKPEERQAEMLVKEKVALEARLVDVTAKVEEISAKLQPVKPIEDVKPIEEPIEEVKP